MTEFQSKTIQISNLEKKIAQALANRKSERRRSIIPSQNIENVKIKNCSKFENVTLAEFSSLYDGNISSNLYDQPPVDEQEQLFQEVSDSKTKIVRVPMKIFLDEKVAQTAELSRQIKSKIKEETIREYLEKKRNESLVQNKRVNFPNIVNELVKRCQIPNSYIQYKSQYKFIPVNSPESSNKQNFYMPLPDEKVNFQLPVSKSNSTKNQQNQSFNLDLENINSSFELSNPSQINRMKFRNLKHQRKEYLSPSPANNSTIELENTIQIIKPQNQRDENILLNFKDYLETQNQISDFQGESSQKRNESRQKRSITTLKSQYLQNNDSLFKYTNQISQLKRKIESENISIIEIQRLRCYLLSKEFRNKQNRYPRFKNQSKDNRVNEILHFLLPEPLPLINTSQLDQQQKPFQLNNDQLFKLEAIVQNEKNRIVKKIQSSSGEQSI